MQINLNSTQQIFPLLSPIFQHASLLSPLQEDTLRKYSYNYEEFGNFKLQNCQDQDYLLLEIQELPQQHMLHELQAQKDLNDSNLPNKKQEQIQKLSTNAEDEPSIRKEKQGPQQIQEQQNSESQKEQIQQKVTKDRSETDLEKLIQNLILNFNKDQNQLKTQILKKYPQNCHQIYSLIIQVMLKKFKKTKKTKEQMVKYCMRKAFKFIADKMKKNRTHNRDIDSCMKIYFSKNHSNKDFSIPFKKNSTEKTMNGSFLKRIFSSENFVEDYKEFLHQFKTLIEQDNFKKVKYLADMIEDFIKNDQREKIQTIKRLPWTQQMLDQTLELSKTLLEYSKPDSPLCMAMKKKQQ